MTTEFPTHEQMKIQRLHEDLIKKYDKYSYDIILKKLPENFWELSTEEQTEKIKSISINNRDKLVQRNGLIYLRKDEEDLNHQKIVQFCEQYDITYIESSNEWVWFDREACKFVTISDLQFMCVIDSAFSEKDSLSAGQRNKIKYKCQIEGIKRYAKKILNKTVQIGNDLYFSHNLEKVRYQDIFAYLPMYCIEKKPIEGEAKAIAKLMNDWGYSYDFIVSLVAYALRNENSLKIAFIIYGALPNTGKSLFQQLLNNILEDTNSYATQLNQLLNPQQRFKLANLHNKLLVRASELDEENTFGTSVFKSLCGGNDALEGEIKGQQKQFSVRFQGLLVISTNHMPNFNGVDEALLSRLVILDFDKQFDPTINVFSNIDIVEYNYVLYDAIEKVKEWNTNKKVVIPHVMDAKERTKYNASRVDPYHRFISSNYIISREPVSGISAVEFAQSFNFWCEENNINVPNNDYRWVRRKLLDKLRAVYPDVIITRTQNLGNRYLNIENLTNQQSGSHVAVMKIDDYHENGTFSDGVAVSGSHSSHSEILYTEKKNSENRKNDCHDCHLDGESKKMTATLTATSEIISETPQERMLSKLISDGDLMEVKNGLYKRVD